MRTLYQLPKYISCALASCVAKASSGQDSDKRSLFELGCLALKRRLLVSFFFLLNNGFRKVFPQFGYSSSSLIRNGVELLLTSIRCVL